jgi:hypothetical protein
VLLLEGVLSEPVALPLVVPLVLGLPLPVPPSVDDESLPVPPIEPLPVPLIEPGEPPLGLVLLVPVPPPVAVLLLEGVLSEPVALPLVVGLPLPVPPTDALPVDPLAYAPVPASASAPARIIVYRSFIVSPLLLCMDARRTMRRTLVPRRRDRAERRLPPDQGVGAREPLRCREIAGSLLGDPLRLGKTWGLGPSATSGGTRLRTGALDPTPPRRAGEGRTGTAADRRGAAPRP